MAEPRRNLEYGEQGGLSRALLEPWMGRAETVGDTGTVDAIGTELAARTWQGINPYAGWLPEPAPGRAV